MELSEKLRILEEELEIWDMTLRKTNDREFIAGVVGCSYFTLLTFATFLKEIKMPDEKEIAARIVSRAYQMHEDCAKKGVISFDRMDSLYLLYEKILDHLKTNNLKNQQY